MAIYKAVINGMCKGQSMINVLWYRTGVGFDLGGLTIGGAKELAEQIKNVVVPKLLACVSNSYTCQDVTVYPYSDGTFDLMYQNPFTLQVADSGTRSEQTDGPARVAIVKFNLEPTAILSNGIFPPKRGYVAIGPIPSAMIDDDGHLTVSWFNGENGQMDDLAAALSENLENLLPPVIFYPIRVHQMNILGIFKPVSYADVSSAIPRRLVSFRRSRMPEA